jgi:predicted nuclease with TOPRIM domain
LEQGLDLFYSALTNYYYFLQISNAEIPDVIKTALSINRDSVINLEETTFKLHQLEDEHNNLQWKYKDLVKDNNDLQQSWNELNDKHLTKEQKWRQSSKEYKMDLESATELAEKQNALTLTLEAKVIIQFIYY